MKPRLLISMAIAIGVLGLVAFLLGQSLAVPIESATPAARVRVAHAIADAPPVDIGIDGVIEPELAGMEFKDVSEYVVVAPGAITITVTAPALGPDLVLSTTLTVIQGNDYTLAAHGTLAEDGYPLVLLAVLDDNEIPPLGHARARFFHLVPGAPAVDVAIQGGPVLLEDVTYGQATPYVDIAAGTYDLELRVTFMGLPIRIPIRDVTAAPNTIYSFFAVGTTTAPDIVRRVDEQYVRVRAFHGVSDGPSVDVWFDGARAFPSVRYKDLTEYAAVMSGTYTLGLALPGLSEPILTQTLDLTGGMDFTIAAAGTLTVADPYAVELIAYIDDNQPPPDGQATLRFIHLVPDAPFPVDVGVRGVTPPLFTAVAYRQATAYVSLDADTYDLEAYATGTGVPIAVARHQLLREGVIYTAFGVGLADGPTLIEIVVRPSDYRLYLPLISRGD
jgi:hypothetical protein